MSTSATPSSGPDDPVPRDAWLGEALRHAPDADAAPPAAVRDAILRRARQASAPRNAWAPAREALRRLWDGRARPMVAGGLGTAAVSVMVALLWWQGAPSPEPPTSQDRDAVGAMSAPNVPANPSAADAGSASPAPPGRAPGATAQTEDAAARAPGDRVVAEMAPREDAERSTRARERTEPTARRKAAPPMRPAAPVDDAAPAGDTARASAASGELARASPPSPADAASPAPAPAATSAAPAPVVTAAASLAGAAAPATASMQRTRPAAAASPGPMGSAARLANGFAPVDPLAADAAALEAASGEWHWMRGTERFAHGEAQRAWFETLQRATAGRWQRAAAADAADAETPIQLFDGMRLRLAFALGPHEVVLRAPGPLAWRAPLSSADSAALEALLRRW